MRSPLMIGLCILMSACSSSNYKELEQPHIGFIGDYSKFSIVETNDGLKSYQYAGERIRSGIYDKVILEPVAFYPQESTTDQVTAKLLAKTKAYIDQHLSAMMPSYLDVVEFPQEGAFILTPKITAIKTSTGDVKINEIIPVGSLIALGKATAGYRHQNVEIYMEIKATDSVDNAFIGGSVKQGKGAEISDSNEVITLDNLKPLLDVWVKDARGTLEKMSALQQRNTRSTETDMSPHQAQ